MANPLLDIMPSVLEHAGTWEGVYRHLDADGNLLDIHRSCVECVFPEQGPVVYIQRNSFVWDDGRRQRAEFSGVLKGDRIYWDTDTFQGYGWVASPQIFLLELQRKDIPGASFYESIVMGPTKQRRARTWHWFNEAGVCYQRTLCDEQLMVAD